MIDLSKAYEAAQEAQLEEQHSEAAVDAAVPHILDALAEVFWARMDDVEPFSVELDDLEAAYRLVRAKAEEVRRG